MFSTKKMKNKQNPLSKLIPKHKALIISILNQNKYNHLLNKHLILNTYFLNKLHYLQNY